MQLSSPGGVESGVSTVAIDRSVLIAGSPLPAPALSREAGDAPTDADIMLRAKAGDQAAFDYLVQKYRRPMVSFMYRMARNTAAAEDLAQEVFLRVYRSRANYEASAKFTTWLYRIATNLAVNHARDTRHERPEVQVSIDEPNEESGTTSRGPGSIFECRAGDRTSRADDGDPKQGRSAPRATKTSSHHAQVSANGLQQIAEVLKKSESATKSLLFRAYETLREQLREFV